MEGESGKLKRCIICDAIKPNDGHPLYDLDRCLRCLQIMIREDPFLMELFKND